MVLFDFTSLLLYFFTLAGEESEKILTDCERHRDYLCEEKT